MVFSDQLGIQNCSWRQIRDCSCWTPPKKGAPRTPPLPWWRTRPLNNCSLKIFKTDQQKSYSPSSSYLGGAKDSRMEHDTKTRMCFSTLPSNATDSADSPIQNERSYLVREWIRQETMACHSGKTFGYIAPETLSDIQVDPRNWRCLPRRYQDQRSWEASGGQEDYRATRQSQVRGWAWPKAQVRPTCIAPGRTPRLTV